MEIAILIPCLNEEQTIAKVVRQFRQHIPQATVYVYDNASTDATSAEAERAGAVVYREDRRGKGFVVQSMFRDIDADVYVMVDGDDTYPADVVQDLIRPVLEGRADMTVGSRLQTESSEFRRFNRTGNQFFAKAINLLFGTDLTDILSGYRAFNRRFVKELPIFVTGFEVETELTIKALERGFVVQEVPCRLASRPEGSHSKLRRFRDGSRILWTIVSLVRDYRPLTVFTLLGAALGGVGLLTALPLLRAVLTNEPVSPAGAVVTVGFALSGVVVALSGLIVHTINRRLQEAEYVNRQVHKESMARYARPLRERRAA
jgi:glycosyltransferase involved in cell wall biosynthesis